MKNIIAGFIEFFYPPFRRLMPLQTFRYAVCGGGNALLGLATYFTGITYLFPHKTVDLGFYVFKQHVAALFLSSIITFIIGFILNRFVVFTTSYLRGRIQLFRYLVSFGFNLFINYWLLKLLVEKFTLDPLFSQVFTIVLVIGISYFTQRHFTFRVKKGGAAEFTDLK